MVRSLRKPSALPTKFSEITGKICHFWIHSVLEDQVIDFLSSVSMEIVWCGPLMNSPSCEGQPL